MSAILGTVLSAVISKKLLGSNSRSGNKQDTFTQQQISLDRQRQKEDARRRQNTMIAIGAVLLVIGAIIAFKVFQKDA